MNTEKFSELMKNREFVKKILAMEKPDEVQKAFADEGVNLTIDEVEILGVIINKIIEKEGKPLTEEELKSIAGGSESVPDDLGSVADIYDRFTHYWSGGGGVLGSALCYTASAYRTKAERFGARAAILSEMGLYAGIGIAGEHIIKRVVKWAKNRGKA